MPFNIIRDDITKLEVDAIVNAANTRLQAGGGVCGAIFEAAGKEKLQQACDEIGYCAFGDAVITKGYALKAKYIIHAAGPMYGRHPVLEAMQLHSCYKKSLELAKTKKISSIAFPVISSGIYGYPKKEAIEIATKAIKEFLQDNEMTIFLVVYDKDAFEISEKLFKDVKTYIDEKIIKDDHKRIPDVFDDIPQISMPMSQSAICGEKSNLSEDCVQDYVSYDSTPKATKFNPKKSLEDLLGIKVETFSEMLLRLIDEKGMTDVEVYKRANIDRKLFSKIRKKDYTPKKTTVIALVIALRLNMAETRQLLQRAGFAFDRWSKFDIIIEYFIENENYDIFEINETLFAFEQQTLGA